MFGRKPAKKLKFAMKVVCEYGSTVTTFTFDTVRKNADEAISSLFIEMAGEKVVCISSHSDGKSIVFPRSKLVFAECTFLEEEK